MNKDSLALRVAKKFNTPEGKIVDVIYSTPDKRLFYSDEEAKDAVKYMSDKTITPHYKDPAIRDMAKKYSQLRKMIFATDYLKFCKVKRIIPVYSEYVAEAENRGHESVEEVIFNFIQSKVFRSIKPTSTGMRDQIYLFNQGIVDAIFLRRFPNGQIWQVGDRLVFTCPTNTELMSGTYQQIFGPLFGSQVDS